MSKKQLKKGHYEWCQDCGYKPLIFCKDGHKYYNYNLPIKEDRRHHCIYTTEEACNKCADFFGIWNAHEDNYDCPFVRMDEYAKCYECAVNGKTFSHHPLVHSNKKKKVKKIQNK